MICRFCGATILDNSVFCSYCGERVARKARNAPKTYPKHRLLADGTLSGQMMVDGERITIHADSIREYKHRVDAYRSGLLVHKGKSITLDKAISNFISDREAVLSPSTITGYRNIQSKRFQDYMQQDIRSINWQEMVSAEAMQEITAKTLKNAWALVSASVQAAGEPVPKVRLPQVIKKEHAFLQPDDIPLFISGLKGKSYKLPALLALQGLRLSEILALQWSDVDIKKAEIHVNGAAVYNSAHELVYKQETKNQTSRRTVPILIPELLKELKRQKSTGNVVNVNPGSLYRWINKTCSELGLPAVGVHGLRHSFQSLCYRAGVSPEVCMMWGGWSNTETMSKVYTHVSKGQLAESKDKVQNYLQTPLTKK